MDKNLKKLSRVELLEIMIDLSDDFEGLLAEHRRLMQAHRELAAENDRLRREAQSQSTSQPARERSLQRPVKVGSIAEEALQANGFFEAAQRSADDYLRQIKELRDALALRVDNNLKRELSDSVTAARQAENKAQACLRDARMQADRTVAQANAQSEAILENARSQADAILANANRRAHTIVAQAQERTMQEQAAQEALPSADRLRGQSAARARENKQEVQVRTRGQGHSRRQSQGQQRAGTSYTGGNAGDENRRGRHARKAEWW